MKQRPSTLIALIPLMILISLMVINVYLFKDDATGGANQLALIIAAFACGVISLTRGYTNYQSIEKGIKENINQSMTSILILLLIGSLIGAWIVSGVVPTIIWIGLKIINPSIFLPLVCLSCALVGLSTGSSWTTNGTLGIAFIAIGKAFGFPPEQIAGAAISGAYFGDKISPLSDTTNLAPAMAGTDLITHVRHMLKTSLPAFLLALVGFFILNSMTNINAANSIESINLITTTIENTFNIHWALLIIPVITLVLVGMKFPALPVLFISAAIASVAAAFTQTEFIATINSNNAPAYQVLVNILANGLSLSTDNETINSLLSRGGMSSMLSTIWLILSAMIFGGAMEASKMLHVIAEKMLTFAHSSGALIRSTLLSSVVTNLTASDQYIALVLPGKMFKNAYEEKGIPPQYLSRALEDAGTVTSVLIPWNSGGAYHAGIFQIGTLSYLPYCFFNILSPLISAFTAGLKTPTTAELKSADSLS